MKNPLISRILGENTSDVVPVIANVPRETYRSRRVQARQIERDEDDDSVRRLVGEAAKEPETVIPDDAEEMDTTEIVVGKPLKQPKEIVQEPSHPSGDKEKFLTPYAALTAPDVTPQSTQPIDPSAVPGRTGPEKFTASELERAAPVSGGEDTAVRAMDVLLGRNRGKPAPEQGQGELEQFEKAGATVTEAQAAAMMGVSPVQEAAAKAANLLVAAADGGSAMPDPTPISDGSNVYKAFRRFNG